VSRRGSSQGRRSHPFYDPMIAKIIVHRQRPPDEALRNSTAALGCDGHRWHRDEPALSAQSCGHFQNLYLEKLQLHFWAPLRLRGRPSRSLKAERRRRFRTIPAASAIGTSACHLPGRWTISRSASRTPGWQWENAGRLSSRRWAAGSSFMRIRMIALTGAEMGAKLDGKLLPRWDFYFSEGRERAGARRGFEGGDSRVSCGAG
jgi:hypothetical protein